MLRLISMLTMSARVGVMMFEVREQFRRVGDWFGKQTRKW